MAYRQPTTPRVQQTAHSQDWNTPRRPRTPRGEYAHLRRLMVIPTPSNPGTPAAVVCQ
jgi:hypothetical protein